MKVELLPVKGKFYKANLHTHSTCSDGRWTPEQIKEQYTAHGYSIVAYTDHHVFLNHNDLSDEQFLALNGYEIDVPEDKPWDERCKTCHFCLIALDGDRTVQRLYHDSVFIDQNIDKIDIDKEHEPMVRRYDPKWISDIMKEARDDGFFVTYNHPVWSLENNGEYLTYHGMHAMEMVNYSSFVTGHEEHNGSLYDSMLHNGEQIYCVATDDNHDVYPADHPMCDSFGGFTMIKAEELSYSAIAQALLDGHFYASEGPEIYELYYDGEEERIYIKTSPAVRVFMSSGERYGRAKTAELKGDTVTELSFSLKSKRDEDYIRFIIRDREGKEAYTNAYRIGDIRKKANQI